MSESDDWDKLEFSLSNQILRMIAKGLGIDGHIKFRRHYAQSPKPFIMRYYGQRLLFPQSDDWVLHVSVTVDQTHADIDVERNLVGEGLTTVNLVSFRYCLSDPRLIDLMVADCQKVLSEGRPLSVYPGLLTRYSCCAT